MFVAVIVPADVAKDLWPLFVGLSEERLMMYDVVCTRHPRRRAVKNGGIINVKSHRGNRAYISLSYLH